jgi:glycosyltransferase involved in cell wall biosynthesis
MGNSLRVCYLTFDSLNEGVGQSQIVPLVKGLSKNGHKVTVISFEKHKSNLDSDLMNAGVSWIPLEFGKFGVKGLPTRIYRMAKNIPDADIYHCRSDLPLISLALRKKRALFLWDVRSLWFEQKAIVDGREASGFIYFLARKLEKYAAKNATAINVLAEPLLEELLRRNKIISEIQTVIPTSVDLEKFQYVDKDESIKKILLSGTLNEFYDVATTKRILQVFNENGFDIEWARGAESNRGDLNEKFIQVSSLEHREMPSRIAQSSLGIAVCRTDCVDVLKGVMPTKIAEFLAVGRPVIVSRGMGELDRLIKNSNTGIVLEDGMTDSDVVTQVENLLLDPELSKRCRSLAETHFSMELAISKYANTYQLMSTLKA